MCPKSLGRKESGRERFQQSLLFCSGLLFLLFLELGVGLYTAIEYGQFSLLYSPLLFNTLKIGCFPAIIGTVRFVQITQSDGWTPAAIFFWIIFSIGFSGLTAFYFFDGPNSNLVFHSVWASEIIISALLYTSFTLVVYLLVGYAARSHSPKATMIILSIPLVLWPASFPISYIS